MKNITIKSSAGSFSGNCIDKINIFYGIPYAQSCADKNRWNSPKELNSNYRHEKSCRGPSAYQTVANKSFMFDPTLPKSSEDCLNLNIASPKDASNLPVMIWIHGGAYLTGSANGALYQMESLVSKGVVLVTINYRLGPLGFLKLDEVTRGLIPATGNEGLLDQRLAIKWIKNNIEAFGGNPENITIFGESAGSWSCALQVGMGINGDFQKVICQSGGADAARTKDQANKWGELFLSKCRDQNISVKDLKTIDPNKLIVIARLMRHSELSDGSSWVMPEVGFAPVIDNVILKENYLDNFNNNNFELIAGVTLDEYRLWSTFHPLYKNLSKENLNKRLSKIFNHSIEEIINLYSNYISEDNYGYLLSAIMTDLTFGSPVEDILSRNKNSYGYIFTTQSPLLKGELGAFHASELPYLFGAQSNVNYKKWTPDYRDTTSALMQNAWTNFAKNSNPSSEYFEWIKYKDRSNYALIGSALNNIKSPFKERYNLLNNAKNF
ncbi:carboxylesterase family protein [Gammaproteobacteria bacterium]|nr:carboxylesterase family protein [Gammaproteobacteria bacterium]